MKVVLPVTDNSLEAKIDSRFGRCNYFALVDTEKNEFEFIVNEAQESGSGVNAANNVLKISPHAIIVNSIGPKAFKVIKNAGVKIYSANTEDIAYNLKLLMANELKELDVPNK